MPASKYLILNVEMTKQRVNTGESFIIRVSVNTWDFLAKNYTWQSLYENYEKWSDLINGS
ncbi:hypothetical protein [uncultured Thomasclavelia sp.]|uniref:hypothetical protein n=1 Tax=uncultured Thomasclavelia sp. TaxID=3025759 RepID=UPI00263A2CB3|nr:hypothetical protein [uncultured Thomasclavelia sp.]